MPSDAVRIQAKRRSLPRRPGHAARATPETLPADARALERLFETLSSSGQRGDQNRIVDHLQRTQGNAFVQRFVTNVAQRRPTWADKAGWADARAPSDPKNKGEPAGVSAEKGIAAPTDSGGKPVAWNAFAQEIDSNWRIPLDGLSKGAGDGKVSETPESSAGRAIAYVPSSMAKTKPDSVEVLLHFHGFGVGYRQLAAKTDYGQVLAAQQVRDVELYRVPQQLEALQSGGRPIIAILPQGKFVWVPPPAPKPGDPEPKVKPKGHFSLTFGEPDTNPTGYLDEVIGQLATLLWSGKKPAIGSIISSGHSGGGPRALAAAQKARSTGGASHTELLLFDAINFRGGESGEYWSVRSFLEDRIHEDAVALKDPKTKSASYLQSSFRFRGMFHGDWFAGDPSKPEERNSYAYWYTQLNKAIKAKLDLEEKNGLSSGLSAELAKHYTVQAVPGTSHEQLMGNATDPKKPGKGSLYEALK